MKPIPVVCPNCGSVDTFLYPVGQKIGVAIGGIIGTLLGMFGKFDSKKVDALIGFFTGASTGYSVGKYLDQKAVHTFKCQTCGKIFML